MNYYSDVEYYVVRPDKNRAIYQAKIDKQKTCKVCIRLGYPCKRHSTYATMFHDKWERITDKEIIKKLNNKYNKPKYN